MSTQDEKYMQMALNLARRGISSVEPNPAVGAIIVKANQIIGRGWHRKFGGPHAEIDALEDCQTLGVKPSGATMFVTLEPCSHQGKTAPCTQAIISAGLARVFIATIDPSEHANGRGVGQLREAGIDVQIGICEAQAKLLNAPFIKFASTGKCWVTLKWAQTIDSKIAWAGGSDERRWISNELSRRDVHKLRRRAQAVLVGINTVITDDPLLTARPSRGKKATRVVMDSHLRIPLDCQLLATVNKSPVIILASQQAVHANPWVAEEITRKGAELLAYPNTHGRSNLHFLLDELSNRGITQLLVEGGPSVLTSFLRENLADEIVVYIAPIILGAQGSTSIAKPMAELAQATGLHNVDVERLGDDVRLRGLTEKAISEIQSAPESNFESNIILGTGSVNKRQVVKLAIEGREVPYVPWQCGFTVEAAEKLRKHFGQDDLEQVLDNHFVKLGSDMGFFTDLGNHRFRDVFGVVWDRSVDRDIGVVEGYILPEPTLQGYDFPDPLNRCFFEDIPEKISKYGDCFRVFKIGFSLYERAWTLRGMENLMKDFLDHPDFVLRLLRSIADYNIAQATEALKYDIDAVYFGDDWGQQTGLQMGPRIWRRFILPELKRMYSLVREAGKFVFIHSCGKVDELFDDLIEIGLNCFNPFQPEVMDVFDLMKRYRGRLAFHGGLSTQRTLPYGSVEDVRKETRRLLEAGTDGGYIFAPAHAVEGDVPLENMLAFIEILHAQAGYKRR